jgi:hypothetical protein
MGDDPMRGRQDQQTRTLERITITMSRDQSKRADDRAFRGARSDLHEHEMERACAHHLAPNLCGLTGSYFPLATTKAEQATGDARPSLQELYGNHAGFCEGGPDRCQRSEVVRERFLLPEDANADIAAAEASDICK